MKFQDLEKVLETAKELAKGAGRIILEVYNRDFSVDYKDDRSPITEVDRKANDYIVKNLKSKYPECAILAEESKDDPERLGNDWCFIIDPLDGTKEFCEKKRRVYREYCIMLPRKAGFRGYRHTRYR